MFLLVGGALKKWRAAVAACIECVYMRSEHGVHRVAFAVDQRHWQAVFIVLALAPAAHQSARRVCSVRAGRAMNVSVVGVGNDSSHDCVSDRLLVQIHPTPIEFVVQREFLTARQRVEKLAHILA